MSRVREEHKARLLAEGKWPDFVLYRDKLKADGTANAKANTLAVLQFLGDDTAAPKAAKPPKKAPALLPPSPVTGSVSPVRSSHTVPVGGGGPSSLADPTTMAVMADFEGKSASAVESILWVADHLRIVDVKPSDCPSKSAWSMLVECRINPLFCHSTFWQALYAKTIPSRSQLDDRPDAAGLDGEHVIESIRTLRVMKADAESLAAIPQEAVA